VAGAGGGVEWTCPIAKFNGWLDTAQAHRGGLRAMTLSTVRADGRPSARTVILGWADANGFVFGTDVSSPKMAELCRAPHGASLTFNFPPVPDAGIPARNIRVDGVAGELTSDEADAIFARRPLKSKLGVLVGGQSAPLTSPEAWNEAFEQVCKDHGFAGGAATVDALPRDEARAVEIKRPAHWGGSRIVPDRIEFWEEANATGAPPLHLRDEWSRAPSSPATRETEEGIAPASHAWTRRALRP